MIANRWAAQLSKSPDALAIQTAERAYSYAEIAAYAQQLRLKFDACAGQTVGVRGGNLPERVIALLAIETSGATACFFPHGMHETAQADWADKLQLHKVFNASGLTGPLTKSSEADSAFLTAQEPAPDVWMFTSGTTGPPQPVKHRWESLTSSVHESAKYRNRRWLMAYDPSSFAGMQVWLQALLTGGSVHDVSGAKLEEIANRMRSEQIEFASGTPTFWRMLLGEWSQLKQPLDCLEQITLGGEPVSDGTLSALQAAFPKARLTHIYATTELGVCFHVTDGKAGFPQEFLENSQPNCPANCQLRISAEGELEVSSTRQASFFAQPSESDWMATGDLVSVQSGRVRFLGRKSEVILVGGSKVLPAEVENVIRAVPGVADVRVSGQPSSLLGAIVKAEVQPHPKQEEQTIRAAILAACETELARHQRPALIEFTSELSRTPTGKLVRSEPTNEIRNVGS